RSVLADRLGADRFQWIHAALHTERLHTGTREAVRLRRPHLDHRLLLRAVHERWYGGSRCEYHTHRRHGQHHDPGSGLLSDADHARCLQRMSDGRDRDTLPEGADGSRRVSDDRRGGADRRGLVDPAAAAAGQRVADREYDVREAIRRELALDHEAAVRAGTDAETRSPVIEVRDVSLSFDIPVLQNISFALYPGETVCVVGESGSGKSTILTLILRLLVPDAGSVFTDGQHVTTDPYTAPLRSRQPLGTSSPF